MHFWTLFAGLQCIWVAGPGVPPLNFARSISLVFAAASPLPADRAHPAELTAAWVAQLLIGSALLLVGCALHLFLVNDLSAGQIAAWLRKPSEIQYEDVGPSPATHAIWSRLKAGDLIDRV